MVQSSKKEVLLMFSGGRDSFLSACKLVSQGYIVRMITFDNGCISGLNRPGETVSSLIHKFGNENILFEGVYSIASIKHEISDFLDYIPLDELAAKYNKLLMGQTRCLLCKTAMYIAAIKYCKAKDIKYLSEGARESQGFFVEKECMINKYKQLCLDDNIELITPVFKLNDDWKRKIELIGYGFDSKTYEMQCFLGTPLKERLNKEQINSLLDFFDNELLLNVKKIINEDDAFCNLLKIGNASKK